MSQITSGIRAILSNPIVYSALQRAMGAQSVKTMLAEEAVRALPGQNVLDIGCGTADTLDYLPSVQYWGFDLSEAYIKQAKDRYGSRGHFFCQEVGTATLESLPQMDIVLAFGVLHHLDDETAQTLVSLAHRALKPGGRLVTVDPCFEIGQNKLARFLISRDRGQNVRTRIQYEQLAKTVFPNTKAVIRHQSWIPYTRCLMECTRP